MCMGCMSNADFLVTGGVMSIASLRIGLRRILPVTPAFARPVTDLEAEAFVASLSPTPIEIPDTADAAVPAVC